MRFQFTPLREGRRHFGGRAEGSRDISIHAPPRGATRSSGRTRWQSSYFNSRPSARGDGCNPDALRIKDISIHAPPRGATRFGALPARHHQAISIHAPPRGATIATCFRGGAHLFQFTPLREGRQTQFTYFRSKLLFQFTPLREGRLQLLRCRVRLPAISIHAPPRGATILFIYIFFTYIFQFTPLREGRLGIVPNKNVVFYFNSRPSARGDVCVLLSVVCIGLFQFTPLREGRHVWTRRL